MLVRVPWLPVSHGLHSGALLELVDIFQTIASLAGIMPNVTDTLEGYDFSPVLVAGGVAPKNWRKAAFSQYPRCMNSTQAHEPPFTPNRDPCCGHPAAEFTHMGLSVRTVDWRYTEWRIWDGVNCKPRFEQPPSGIELYSHQGDITPACFDCFENVNEAGNANNAAVVKEHAAMIHSQFSCTHDDCNRGCPGSNPDEEDAASAMQIFTQGGERLPATATAGMELL